MILLKRMWTEVLRDTGGRERPGGGRGVSRCLVVSFKENVGPRCSEDIGEGGETMTA